MMARWTWILAVLAAMLIARPASAQMVPCPSEPIDTLAGFSVKGFHCMEYAREERAGVLYRVVADTGTPEQSLSPYREMLGDIVERSFTVWRGARAIETHAVTFVLLPAASTDPGTLDGALAQTFNPKLGWNNELECLVIVNPARLEAIAKEQGTQSNRADFFGIVIAHELAHCLQDWGWSKQAMAADAHWWVEGIAELLGAVAYPGSVDILRRRYPLFKATAATVPLTRMAYESVVFFQWIWNHDHADIFAFMDEMPACRSRDDCGYTGEEYQRRATIRFLGKARGGEGGAQIQVFAQDFVDNAIPNAAGAPVGPPDPAPKQLVEDSATVPIGGPPWTIQTRDLTIAKGEYTTLEYSMLQSARAREAQFPAEWDDLPFTIKPGCEGQAEFKLAFFVLNDSAEQAHYQLEKSLGCQKIAVGKAIDACAVGAWSLDKDRYRDLFAAQAGKDGRIDAVTGSVDFAFAADGTARITAKDFTASITPTTEIESHIGVTVTGTDDGRWSAENGRLVYDTGGGTLATSVHVEVGAISQTIDDQQLFERGLYDYSCAAGSLTLRYAGPRVIPADRAPTWRLISARP